MMGFRGQYTHCVSDGRDDSCSVAAARIINTGAHQSAGEADIGVLSPESRIRESIRGECGITVPNPRHGTRAPDHAKQNLSLTDFPGSVHYPIMGLCLIGGVAPREGSQGSDHDTLGKNWKSSRLSRRC